MNYLLKALLIFQDEAIKEMDHVRRLRYSVLMTIRDGEELENKVFDISYELHTAAERAFVCRGLLLVFLKKEQIAIRLIQFQVI